MAGVTLTGISKTYSQAGMPAINDLDLEIRDGQFVTLLGPSGCGKTTTLRLIAGYMAPDAGTIHADDRLISSKDTLVPPEHRGMGMVFQNYAVWPHKTVFENVVFGLRLRKVPSAKARERVEQALALVGLSGYERRLPNEISGGQQQRVALARSIVVEPQILLLDEPLSNLDAKLREHMRTELKQLQRRIGITFIYVTHDQAEALALSDQIAVIHEGRLQQFDSPREIYNRPINRTVADFMGNVNLLSGKVISADGAKGEILIADRLRVIAALPAGIERGAVVDVALRPENIELKRAETNANSSGKIVDHTFLGNISEYHIAVADRLLRVQTHPSVRIAVGDDVDISIAPETVNVFAQTETSR
ncbi:MAG TPA: ABC transporter ATP-binding protein [Pseudolabrys sp.]|nr:ABC transporter ATP-binding protein [Pseudolabrys sp.]